MTTLGPEWTAGNPFVGDGTPADSREFGPEVSPKTRESRRINSQAKGKRAERQLANWWKSHGFPDASRAVKTGDRFAPDGGDLVLEHEDFRLVIEVKHHAGGLTDGQVAEYGAKLVRQVAQSKGTMGILVERRDRVSDPARWWVHLDPEDYACLVVPLNREFSLGYGASSYWYPLACRTTVGYFALLIYKAGLTAQWEG